MLLLKAFFHINLEKETAYIDAESNSDELTPAMVTFKVTNELVSGLTMFKLHNLISADYVMSRIEKPDGTIIIPTSKTEIHLGDVCLVVCKKQDSEIFNRFLGPEIEKKWEMDRGPVVSRRILVTRTEYNGTKLGSLHLHDAYQLNVTRVNRAGIDLMATPGLTLQMGDRLTVVGEAAAIQNVEKILGNAVKNLDEPNLVAVFVGLILGLVLGSIPVSIPGISLPVKLGLAGGPIVIGILIGTFGPRLHMITYTTYSANLMLRALGLSMYLACLGLEAGAHFFETVMRPEGALWLLLGFLLTFVPVVLLGVFALRVLRIDFGSVSGMLCGSMANPMALTYANDTIEGDNPSVSYATVYPLCMFLRVVIIQVMLMIFL